MMSFQFIDVRREGPIEYVTLNRPDVRNAFNDVLVGELRDWALGVPNRPGVRAAVLGGIGSVFCAGGDLVWMARAIHFSHEENVADARHMAAMYEALDHLPVPLVGRVHGAALGGGTGLAAVCDMVVAEESAVFGFTEVKLGILPGVISPYVLAKIGRSAARELFLTGARFSAARAREIGLVHAVVPAERLDETVREYLKEILAAGPEAIAGAKRIIREAWAGEPSEITALTVDAIAARRVSAEGQEGLRAFLEKRRPSWRGELP
jgi:methylglutaconyl-CoA hydratase